MAGFTLTSTSHVSWIGDSLSTDFGGPGDAVWKDDGFMPTIQSFYGSFRVVARPYVNTSGAVAARSTYPTFAINGLAGRQITDVSPTITNFIDPNTTSTHVVIQLGVNDAVAGTSSPTLTTAVNKIHDDLATAGIHSILWIGPFTHGEKWPSGQNANDTDIDRVDALLSGLMAGYGAGYDYVPWRQVYAIQEPLRNPSNLTQGIFTSDGTHPRTVDQIGMSILIGCVRSKITLT